MTNNLVFIKSPKTQINTHISRKDDKKYSLSFFPSFTIRLEMHSVKCQSLFHKQLFSGATIHFLDSGGAPCITKLPWRIRYFDKLILNGKRTRAIAYQRWKFPTFWCARLKTSLVTLWQSDLFLITYVDLSRKEHCSSFRCCSQLLHESSKLSRNKPLLGRRNAVPSESLFRWPCWNWKQLLRFNLSWVSWKISSKIGFPWWNVDKAIKNAEGSSRVLVVNNSAIFEIPHLGFGKFCCIGKVTILISECWWLFDSSVLLFVFNLLLSILLETDFWPNFHAKYFLFMTKPPIVRWTKSKNLPRFAKIY